MKKLNSFVGVFAGAALMVASLSAKESPVGIKPNGCKGPVLCDARPIIDGCGWSLDIGVLIETMRVGNANFYYNHGADGGTTWNEPSRTSNQYYIGFDLDPGLRAAVGYTSMHDDWMLKAAFEWLSSTGRSDLEQDNAQIRATNVPLILYEDDYQIIRFQEADARLIVDYYLLDLSVSKGAYFSDKFSFEPLGGIKLNWINYNSSLKLANAGNTLSTLPTTTSWLRRNITEFWGVGPMIGFNANYHLFVGWSIFSKMDVAILIGETYLKDGIGFVTTETYPGGTTSTNTIQMLSPATRATIGLQYERDLFEETQHLAVRFGFDGRWYYNQYPQVNYPASLVTDPAEQFLESGVQINEGNYFGMMGLLIDVCWSY